MQVAWLIVPWHHFAMHGLLIARECIYCAMSPWYLDGETIGWALFLLVRGIIMCFVHGQWNSGVLHHGDDSGFAPIPSDTDQMCVVFPCLGADWQSVKTGTTLEWVTVILQTENVLENFVNEFYTDTFIWPKYFLSFNVEMKTCWYKYGISMNKFGLFFFLTLKTF